MNLPESQSSECMYLDHHKETIHKVKNEGTEDSLQPLAFPSPLPQQLQSLLRLLHKQPPLIYILEDNFLQLLVVGLYCHKNLYNHPRVNQS